MVSPLSSQTRYANVAWELIWRFHNSMTIHICFNTIMPKQMVVDILSGGHQIEMILTIKVYLKEVCQQMYAIWYYLELK